MSVDMTIRVNGVVYPSVYVSQMDQIYVQKNMNKIVCAMCIHMLLYQTVRLSVYQWKYSILIRRVLPYLEYIVILSSNYYMADGRYFG